MPKEIIRFILLMEHMDPMQSLLSQRVCQCWLACRSSPFVFFGDYALGAEWQRKLPYYRQVIFDQAAALKNKDILKLLKPTATNFNFWDYKATARPSNDEISLLQKLVAQDYGVFPRFVEGCNIGLVWLKDIRKIILFNLLETENQGIVKMEYNLYQVHLKALSFAILDIAGTFVEFDTAVDL